MQLEQQFELPLPPDAVWPAFGDVALLVDCLPGASLTGPPVDGAWPLRFDVRLGPISASFQGQGRLQRDDATHSGGFEGQATDRKTGSRVKGQAQFALQAQGEGTRVTVRLEHQLSGALAQFGRAALVKEIAGTLTAQFAARLQARLAPAGDAATPPASAPSPASPGPAEDRSAPALAPAAPLSLTALLWQTLCRWVGSLFGRATPGSPR